jgi:transposase
MEDVLALYARPYRPQEPVISIDEKSKELRSTPRQASRPGRIDYEYRRHGTRNIFLTCEPKRGWRHAEVTARRTKRDFALHLRGILNGRYRRARRVHAIVDNLNTHSAKAVCEGLGHDPAHPPRWLRRVRWHYTPKHASWLNAVEAELSVLGRQCLNRRIATEGELDRETGAWVKDRNRRRVTLDWTFTRQRAEVKFPSLYVKGMKTSMAEH